MSGPSPWWNHITLYYVANVLKIPHHPTLSGLLCGPSAIFPKKHYLILILLRPQSYPDAPLVFSPYHGFQSWLEAMSGYLHNENNFFLKISAFCFVNSKNVFTFVHSSKFMSYGMYKCYSLAVKPRVTLSA
jgi:hypothetical protein